jgi:nitroreductase
LIVITYRTDGEKLIEENLKRTMEIQGKTLEELGGYKKMLEGAVTQAQESGKFESWVKAQAYIPLGIMLETAALLRIDAGPMEGFNNELVDEILDLKSKNLKSTSMLALGYRGEDPASLREKVRRDFKEVVEFV